MPRSRLPRQNAHARLWAIGLAFTGALALLLGWLAPRAAAAEAGGTTVSTAAGPLEINSDQSLVDRSWPSIGATAQDADPAAAGLRSPSGRMLSLAPPKNGSTVGLRLDLEGDSRLLKTEDGGVAVVVRTASRNNSTDSAARSGFVEGLPSVAIGENERIVAILSAPSATDASGSELGASFTIKGDEAQVEVDGEAGSASAVETLLMSVGTSGDGWITYGVEGQLFPNGSVSVEAGERTEEGGCAFKDSGTADGGEVGRSHQLALNPVQCAAVIESEETSALGGIMLLASGPRRAHYTNWQQDPIGIKVNLIRDWVTWTWNGSCTVSIVDAGHYTEVYSTTGWAKTEHTAGRQRDCAAATKWSHVTFAGGQYFPACFGSKVTTYYHDNIVQGYRDGTAGFYVYHVTGGAPCYALLSWGSDHGNILV